MEQMYQRISDSLTYLGLGPAGTLDD